MLSTVNSILMLDHHSKSSTISEEQRRSVVKAKLTKLERLQQMIAFEIQRSNNQLRFQPKQETELSDSI